MKDLIKIGKSGPRIMNDGNVYKNDRLRIDKLNSESILYLHYSNSSLE
jgi:hypothetical protein